MEIMMYSVAMETYYGFRGAEYKVALVVIDVVSQIIMSIDTVIFQLENVLTWMAAEREMDSPDCSGDLMQCIDINGKAILVTQ